MDLTSAPNRSPFKTQRKKVKTERTTKLGRGRRTREKRGEEGREIDETIKSTIPLEFQPFSLVDIAVIPSRKIEIFFLTKCTIFIEHLQDLQSHLSLLKGRT